MFDNVKIREQFPILKKIVYLDNAALVQKPLVAINAQYDFYMNYCISNRTANSILGNQIYAVINQTREKIAKLVDAQKEEVMFTSGTTDSLNKLALMLKDLLKENDEILVHELNHSSNIAPWISIAKKTNAKVVITNNLIEKINEKTKIITIAQVNNSFYSNDFKIQELFKICQEKNIILVNDAAQAIVQNKISLNNSHVIAFSANKFYGPTGLGALVIKKEILNKLSPTFLGGGAITNIDKNYHVDLQPGIIKFEPGTMNLSAIWMFNKSIDFFNNIGYDISRKIIAELSEYAYKRLKKIKNITIYNNPRDSILLFNIYGINAQDVAHYLGNKNIYVRSGNFCVPFIKNYSKKDLIRISFGIYNNKNDIDKLVEELEKGGDFLVI